MNRRTFCIALIAGSIARPASAQDCDSSLWGCSVEPPRGSAPTNGTVGPTRTTFPFDAGIARQYEAIYGRIDGERFPIAAVRLSDIDPTYLRQLVYYSAGAAPGTIIVDPHRHFLYLVQEGEQAIRYGVGVGRQGFGWSGAATIHDKREWPDWYPPKEMLRRQPELWKQMSELQSGIGMHGGARNPLGARAMYLWQGNKTRSIASTAQTSPGPSGRAFPPAAFA